MEQDPKRLLRKLSDAMSKIEEAAEGEYHRIHRNTLCRLSLIEKVVSDGKGRYHVEYNFEKFPTLDVSRRRYGPLKKALDKNG